MNIFSLSEAIFILPDGRDLNAFADHNLSKTNFSFISFFNSLGSSSLADVSQATKIINRKKYKNFLYCIIHSR